MSVFSTRVNSEKVMPRKYPYFTLFLFKLILKLQLQKLKKKNHKYGFENA